MPDDHPSRLRDAAARLIAAGKGTLLDELRLNGELTLESGRSSSASLCRTPRGLFLVLLRARDHGVIDLLTASRTLRYRTQLLGDRLEVDRWRLGVPLGRADQAKRIVAMARITAAFGGPGISLRSVEHEGPWAWSGPFVEDIQLVERTWLQRWLDADEQLLVWLPSDESHEFESPWLVGAQADQVLVISDRRQSLVAISSLGDLWSEALPERALELSSSGVGRSSLRVGARELRLPLGDDKRVRGVLELPALRGTARLREYARALWMHDAEGQAGTRAAAILARIAAADPLAALARAMVVEPDPLVFVATDDGADEGGADEGARDQADPDRGAKDRGVGASTMAVLRTIVDEAGPETGEGLLRWWQRWQVGPELGELVVEHLCELGRRGMEVALPLHEHLRPRLQATLDDDAEDAALLDFVLAEHLLACDRPQRALEVLGERRRQLPSEELADLLPPSPGRGGQQIRIELYELAAAAHRELGDGHVAALAELARLQPLVKERVDALVERLGEADASARELGPSEEAAETQAIPTLLARAERVQRLLDDDDFAAPAERSTESAPVGVARVRALDSEGLELLRHPAARIDGALGRLQGVLAKVVVPDCSALKSYCERANLARDRALASALADATLMLGLGGVEVFVSRGEKSVGLRAYEGDTSFLIIGGDHLEPDSDAFLAPGALRFAVAAELAHLRYAHSRVTTDEVWAGTFDMGLTGLGILLAAAPVLTGLKAPAKHLLDKVGAPALERWRRKLVGRDTRSLSSDNSQVIAAHRAMQLSADRAGLLACGDPAAAIRAMFTVHPAYLSLWPLVMSHGLRATIIRETRGDDQRERERLEDLAVRVAAMLSFYLSDDYATLSATVGGR